MSTWPKKKKITKSKSEREHAGKFWSMKVQLCSRLGFYVSQSRDLWVINSFDGKSFKNCGLQRDPSTTQHEHHASFSKYGESRGKWALHSMGYVAAHTDIGAERPIIGLYKHSQLA